MNIHIIRFVYLVLLFASMSFPAAAQNFTNAIHAYLQQRIDAEQINAGVVVGMVDEHGSAIVSYGKLDNGTDVEANGDTLFEIGSDTKTFTALLLQTMVQRGEMKLDDPAERYLPASVKMPSRNGKKITLRHLAMHASGLPPMPDNLDPKRADNPYADYTVEKLYAFLSRCQLTRDPGAEFVYSNLGMGLLGHLIARRAGTNYETLVVDRICRPLNMDSTRMMLTPELQSRFAVGHGLFGEPVPGWSVPVLSGAGALRSTANDLLKYMSAHLGLTQSRLTPLMKKTYENWLAWQVSSEPGSKIVSHGGGTAGCQSWVGFDPARRRGVVILFNGRRVFDLAELGRFLLKSEWRSDRAPTKIKLAGQVPKLFKAPVDPKLAPKLLDAVVGRYEFAPNAQDHFAGMKLSVWRNGDQLAGQVQGAGALPGMFDLYPESETNFLIRINGARFTFIRNDRGEVTTVIHHETGVPDINGKKVSTAAH